MRFFISYSQSNIDVVDLLCSDLQALGHEVWRDSELSGGQAWWSEILAEIRRADVFLLVLTANSLSSPYCLAEFSYSVSLAKSIVPVQVADVLPSGVWDQLRSLQWIDYRKADRGQVLGLARALFRLVPRALPELLPFPPQLPQPNSTAFMPPEDTLRVKRVPMIGLEDFIPKRSLPKRTWRAHSAPVQWLGFSKGARWLVTCDARGSIAIWDPVSLKVQSRIGSWSDNLPLSVSLADQGELVAIARDGDCRIFKIPGGEDLIRSKIDLVLVPIDQVEVSPRGDLVAVGRNKIEVGNAWENSFLHEYFVDIFDVRTGTLLRQCHNHWDLVRGLCFSADEDRLLISLGVDYLHQRLMIWDFIGGKEEVLSEAKEPLMFSPDDNYIAASNLQEKSVILWHYKTRHILREFEACKPHCVKFSPNSRNILILEGKLLRLWSLSSGKLLAEESAGNQEFTKAIFSPDGHYLAVGKNDGSVTIRLAF